MSEAAPPSLAARIAILAASALTVMAGAAIAPALPAMTEAFAANPRAEALAKASLTLPALFMVVAAPIAGWLADRCNRLGVLRFGLGLYAVAGCSGLVARTLPEVLVGRAFLGIAVATTMTASIALVGDLMVGKERARFLGFQGSAMAFAGVVFLLLGGVLAEVGWRAPFAMYAAAAPILVLTYWALRPCDRRETEAAATPTQTRGPALELIWACAAVFAMMLAFYQIPIHLPFVLSERFGVSGWLVGATLSAGTLTIATVALLTARVREGLSDRRLTALCFGVASMGLLVLAFAPNHGIAAIGVVLAGSGVAMIGPNANMWISQAAPEKIRARWIGVLTASLFMGQAVAPVGSVAVQRSGYAGLGGPFGAVALLCLGMAAIFALASLRTSSKPRPVPSA